MDDRVVSERDTLPPSLLTTRKGRKIIQRVPHDSERNSRNRELHRRIQRHPVKSPRLARRGIRQREATLLGHEYVTHFEIITPSAAQSTRVPRREDRHLRAVEKERAGNGAAIGSESERAILHDNAIHHERCRVVGTRGVVPAAGDAVATCNTHGAAVRNHSVGDDRLGPGKNRISRRGI